MATESEQKNATKIAKRIERALNDAKKCGLVVMAHGDGGSLSVFTKDDFDNASNVDTIFGLRDSYDNPIEPLADIRSSAMKY